MGLPGFPVRKVIQQYMVRKVTRKFTAVAGELSQSPFTPVELEHSRGQNKYSNIFGRHKMSECIWNEEKPVNLLTDINSFRTFNWNIVVFVVFEFLK